MTDKPAAKPAEIPIHSAFALPSLFLFGGLAVLLGIGLTLLLPGPEQIWSLAIHLLSFLALGVAMRALARLRTEKTIADAVDHRASSLLRRVEARETARPALARLEAELLPQLPQVDVGILRLLRQIVREAKERRSSPLFLLMQPYREETLEALFRLQTMQRAALQLGILGTFLGLILALTKLTLLPDGTLEVAGVGDLLSSLQIAFGTSVAGIEVALFTALLISHLRRRQDSYFQRMEEACLSLRSLARQADNGDEYLAELGEIGTATRQLGDRILKQSAETERQTRVIGEGLGRLTETREHLFQFVDRLEHEQAAFLGKMQGVYETLSPETIAESLQTHLQAAVEKITDRVDRGVTTATAGLEKAGEQFGRLRPVFEKMEQVIAEGTGLLQESNRTVASGRAEIAGVLAAMRRQSDEWFTTAREAFAKSLEEALVKAESHRAAFLDRSGAAVAPTEVQPLAELRELVREVQSLRRDLARLPQQLYLVTWWARLWRWLTTGRSVRPANF